VEYIPCYSVPELHWGLLPATKLAIREILIEKNIKKRKGPALCVDSVGLAIVSIYTVCTLSAPVIACLR
jgi:hypothetical protein